MERLALLFALALIAAFVATLHASATHASTSVPPTNGFAGPVLAAPRAIDRDLEPASSGTLHEVACPVAGAMRCWVARR